MTCAINLNTFDLCVQRSLISLPSLSSCKVQTKTELYNVSLCDDGNMDE